MATHILAITYQPKIEGVRNGTIRQTIRPLSKVPRKVGDKLILHGWKGKPYRSPWSWRREEVVKEVYGIECAEDFLRVQGGWLEWSWSEAFATELAQKDRIEPPTGQALKHVLESYHGKFTDKPVQMQVIRW